MSIKIKSVNFQRNGIHGEPFCSVLYTDKKQTFIATFRTEEDNTKESIIPSTCRVVNLEDHTSCWRGDEISQQIEHALHDLMAASDLDTFWELTDRGKEYAKNHITE